MKNKKLILGLVSIVTVGLLTGCSSSSDKTLYDQIIDEGKITFATEGTYAPFSYHDENDELVGYDVEIAQAVAEKLGVEAEFVETKWDGIIAGLDAKKYDTIANQVGITDERSAKYVFTDPYIYSYASIIVQEDNDNIHSFDDLDGKQSSQTATSNWAEMVESYGGKVVATEGFNQSIELVLQGRVDATVNDSVTYLDYINQQPNSKVKVAAQSSEVITSAFPLRKGDSSELQDAINKALKELAEEGKLKEISIKYFGEDVSVEK